MSQPRDDYGPHPSEQPERTPPQNIELELSVLGGAMLEPQAAMPLLIDGGLTRDSFYLEGHGLIWDVMCDLHRQGIPPDSVALLDALRSRNLLERAGGSGVVLGMLNSVPTAANVEHHARRVAEKARLRQLIRACTKVIEDCYRQELPLTDVLDRAESSILALSAAAGGKGYISVAVNVRAYMDRLIERSDEVEKMKAAGRDTAELMPGLPTGFLDLDALTGGLKPGELTIVAARPSVGKTALALNIAHNLGVKRGVPVGMFSLEMDADAITERLLSIGTKHTVSGQPRGIGTDRFRAPDLTDQEWNIITASFKRVAESCIYLDDTSALSIGELKSRCRQMYSVEGVQCIIVDYLQLLHATTTDNRVEEVSIISRGLKQIARELRIPVVALSQLRRPQPGKEHLPPNLSDLRESGAIEQDADVVVFIHRKEAPKDEEPLLECQLIVGKNRNGPTGAKTVRFFKAITRFLDADRVHYPTPGMAEAQPLLTPWGTHE